MASRRTDQIIGELICFVPLVIIMWLAGLFLPCAISMICLLAYKQRYGATVHLQKAWQCFALSYGIFITAGLVCAGLRNQFWFMRNQPLALVLMMAGLSWLNASAGEWQAEYFRMREALKPRPFSVKTAAEGEIRDRCRALGKSKEYEDFCVMAFAWKMRRKQLAAEMGYTERTTKDYITQRKKELERL